ncbi:hypothetical protein COLO4_10925 [Corchorus olitorius]|uniref:Uncharacterized protein n=1 Tax=Corchorus olitorius TaxID=93759 RepID=A0A1R3K6F9_9ROSI|nr:hypothetical protein COLO4_10925 [Corchorus olitorius]
MSLKLLVDTVGERVLCAEAGKEFVDSLFYYILSIPVAELVELVTKQGTVGCVANLYDSLKNLSDTNYIQPTIKKETLLNPRTPTTSIFYRCGNGGDSSSCNHIAYDSAIFLKMPHWNSYSSTDEGYVKEGSYIIMDDLVVSPVSTVLSIVTMLKKLNVKDVGALEVKTFELCLADRPGICDSSDDDEGRCLSYHWLLAKFKPQFVLGALIALELTIVGWEEACWSDLMLDASHAAAAYCWCRGIED